jgi:ribosomal protein S18 acetylase RimI-like enzyme
MPSYVQPATQDDAVELAALHTAVADHLTATYGRGPWSTRTSERGVLYDLRKSRVFLAREGAEIIATFSLTTRKPWAIDPSYFTDCRRPLYLLSMAVRPDRQRRGIGSRCLLDAKEIARAWPADAIRLDSYDAEAGASEFYRRLGCVEMGRAIYRGAPLIYFEIGLGPDVPPVGPP